VGTAPVIHGDSLPIRTVVTSLVEAEELEKVQPGFIKKLHQSFQFFDIHNI
jgi:hypothetical protein